MENPGGGFENESSARRLYHKIQSGLRRISGVPIAEPGQKIQPADIAVEGLQAIDENELRMDSDYYIPASKRDGQTVFIFGRIPETTGGGYVPFGREQQVKLLLNDTKIPRRALGITFHPDGGITLRNVWKENLVWGIMEDQNNILKPNGSPAYLSREQAASFRVELPGGYLLRSGSIGGAGNETPKLRSVTFGRT